MVYMLFSVLAVVCLFFALLAVWCALHLGRKLKKKGEANGTYEQDRFCVRFCWTMAPVMLCAAIFIFGTGAFIQLLAGRTMSEGSKAGTANSSLTAGNK